VRAVETTSLRALAVLQLTKWPLPVLGQMVLKIDDAGDSWPDLQRLEVL